MLASSKKIQLLAFLADADEEKINSLYTLFKDQISGTEEENLTQEQLAFLTTAREKHLAGESKSYSWDETKAIVMQRKAS
jgi:hypothetical protein